MSEGKQFHADPTALGLFGLAMVTLVASSMKLGITDGYSYLLPWVIFLGACAQVIAGILDFKKGNAFGGTAFCAYGLFWFGMAFSWMMNMGVFGDILQSNIDPKQMAFAFVGYFIVSVFFTIGATKTNKVLFFDFFFIVLLFVGLAVSTFAGENAVGETFHWVAAISELIISILSFWGAGANIVNTITGNQIIPLGKAFGNL